jgi:hypothetical protein
MGIRPLPLFSARFHPRPAKEVCGELETRPIPRKPSQLLAAVFKRFCVGENTVAFGYLSIVAAIILQNFILCVTKSGLDVL